MNNNYNINDLIKAGKNGNTDELLSKLSPEDAKRIKNVLSDKKLTEKLLQSEQAQKLIKTFMKEGFKNG